MDSEERAGSAPGADDPTEVASTPGGRGGSRIGPYVLLQKLGEGGMGEVWEAEQSEPVRRRVAVKVIERGMDAAAPPHERATLRRSLAVRRRTLGDDHPMTARSLEKLAGVLEERSDPEGALPLLREAREVFLARLGAEHQQTVAVTVRLVAALRATGRPEEAERLEVTP